MASILDGFFSLGRQANRAPEGKSEGEGVVSTLLPELDLNMPDEELLALKKKWEASWKEYSGPLELKQKTNEDYYLGKQYSSAEMKASERPLADNKIFSALESFLPIATRQSPDPVVEADDSPEGQALAKKVQKMLAFLIDELTLKLKIQRTVRSWALAYLGCMKVGWSMVENEIDLKVIRPQKLMLDPEATILEDGTYTGDWIGESRTDTARVLLAKFPNKEKEITDLCQGKMATELQYTEWWHTDYVFWTCKDIVLGSTKNPHWNYPSTQPQVDEFGVVSEQEVAAARYTAPRPREL